MSGGPATCAYDDRPTRHRRWLRGLTLGVGVCAAAPWALRQVAPTHAGVDLVGQAGLLLCMVLGGLLAALATRVLVSRRQDRGKRPPRLAAVYLLLGWSPVLAFPTAWQVTSSQLSQAEQSIEGWERLPPALMEDAQAATRSDVPADRRALVAGLVYTQTGLLVAVRDAAGRLGVYDPSSEDLGRREQWLQAQQEMADTRAMLTQQRRHLAAMSAWSWLAFALAHLGAIALMGLASPRSAPK